MSRSDAEVLQTVARSLAARARAVSRDGSPLPPLAFLTDPRRTPEPWRVAARLPAGSAVFHRTFGAPDALETATQLRRATQQAGVRLLIARDEDLAVRVGADGLHLPERDLGLAAEIRERQPRWLMTGTVHAADGRNLSALDAVLIAPVFRPGPGSEPRAPLGVTGFDALATELGLAAYALGGVGAETAPHLLDSTACGLAGVAAIAEAFGDEGD